MQFAFTEEQTLIRDSVETACKELCDREALFNTIEKNNGFHKHAWTTLCIDMGLGLTALPEARGGLGLSTVELASIQEKIGRYLLPTPFFTSIVLSGTALIHADHPDLFDSVLSDISTGNKIASFAFLDKSARDSAATGAVKYDESGSITGTLGFVQYGDIADYFIVQAQDPSGEPLLVVVDARNDDIEITPRVSMDLTRPVSQVTFNNAKILGGKPLTTHQTIINKVFDIGRICLAAEQLGASEAILEKTQAFALERRQFGRIIGSFQAVKHRLADMMVLNEAAKSAAWYAACVVDEMPEELSVAAATAMVVTSRALKRNSKSMIQLHGGMGFTWECDAHLYLKRAEMSTRYLGDETVHRETLATFALGENSKGAVS